MDRCLTGAAGLPSSWCCASLRPPLRAPALAACRGSERARRSPLASRERRRQSARLDCTAPAGRARRARCVGPLRASVEEEVAPARAGAAPAAPARTATARGEDAAAFDASQQSAGKWAFFTAELVAVLAIMYAVREILYALRGIVYAPAGCPATRARDLAHPPALRSSRRERRACPLPDAPPPALGTLAACREPPS